MASLPDSASIYRMPHDAPTMTKGAIAIAPSYGHAHSVLPWVLLRRTDWSGDVVSFFAEAEARTALDIDEQDPWAHLTYGLVFYRQRRHGEAERAYGRAGVEPKLRTGICGSRSPARLPRCASGGR
jgi:hypothetical protein